MTRRTPAPVHSNNLICEVGAEAQSSCRRHGQTYQDDGYRIASIQD
jgi:hypothetical protein